MSRPISGAEDRPSGFQPLSAPRSLTQQLFTRLASDITSGKLAPGSRLPTEQEMIAATGVSRTVVREAVAHLRAEGLVITRQGVGAFVAENVRAAVPHRLRRKLDVARSAQRHGIAHGDGDRNRGLAADRATEADLKKVTQCYEDIDAAIGRGELAVDQDFAFHCAIADATGNPQFRRFLEYLGRFIIPRQSVWGRSGPVLNRTHLDMFQREHRQILQAIQSRAVTKARTAMREHLLNSRRRHQKLADELGVK